MEIKFICVVPEYDFPIDLLVEQHNTSLIHINNIGRHVYNPKLKFLKLKVLNCQMGFCI
jgi:hypothetical protein